MLRRWHDARLLIGLASPGAQSGMQRLIGMLVVPGRRNGMTDHASGGKQRQGQIQQRHPDREERRSMKSSTGHHVH